MPHGVKRRAKRILKRHGRKRGSKRMRSGRGLLSRSVLLKTLNPKREFKWDDTDTYVTCNYLGTDYGQDRDIVVNCWLNGNMKWMEHVIETWPYVYDYTQTGGAVGTSHYPTELPLVTSGVLNNFRYVNFIQGWESFLLKNSGHLDAYVKVYEVTALQNICTEARSNNIGVSGDSPYYHKDAVTGASMQMEYDSFKTGQIEQMNLGCTPCTIGPQDCLLTAVFASGVLNKGFTAFGTRETVLSDDTKVTAMHVYGGNDGNLNIISAYSPQFVSGMHGKFDMMDLHSSVKPYFKVKMRDSVKLPPGGEGYWKLKHKNVRYSRENIATYGKSPVGIHKGSKTLVFVCYGQFAHSNAADGSISTFTEAVTALQLGGVAPVSLQVRHKYGVQVQVPLVDDTPNFSIGSIVSERKQDESIEVGYRMRAVQQEDPVTETAGVN